MANDELCVTGHGKRIKTSPVDDGGHLIGTQFGGTGDQINYVPMPVSVNRAGGNDNWYAMEQAWADYLSNRGTSTKIKDLVITVNYSGGSKKPTTFDVTWKQFNTKTGDYDRNSKRINNY